MTLSRRSRCLLHGECGLMVGSAQKMRDGTAPVRPTGTQRFVPFLARHADITSRCLFNNIHFYSHWRPFYLDQRFTFQNFNIFPPFSISCMQNPMAI
jgi:hypothetical protein